MKVLLVHNYYQQPGGEDVCFADEGRLLEENGCQVVRFTLHNDAIPSSAAVKTALRALWSRQTYRDLSRLIARERPAVMHCTNTFPLVSPSAYYAARRHGVAVVQALHNYRLICPGALLMRQGAVCEDCLGRSIALPAVRHGCYRGSQAGSAVVAAMLATHKAAGTWSRAVDRYYALTEFARGRFIAGGLPAEKLLVKPNFVFPPSRSGEPVTAAAAVREEGVFLFVGRLSEEKGILTALAAWRHVPAGARLRIVGDGPLAEKVRDACRENPQVEWLGAVSNGEAIAQMRKCTALIAPSVCFENFPRSIVEAYSEGTPVIASRLGAMAELVDHEQTGLLFTAGDAQELAKAAARLSQDGALVEALRQQARRVYLDRYTPQQNFTLLMEIYRQAIAARHGDGACAAMTPQAEVQESEPPASAGSVPPEQVESFPLPPAAREGVVVPSGICSR